MSAKEEQPKQEEKEEQVVEQQVEAEVGKESSEKPRLTREEHFEQQKEIDSRSIYVGNVDYSSTPEELEKFFNVAGVINRITILYDKYTGRPKGFAYVEFANKESVEGALKMNESEFKGRKLNVSEKRTNVPGFSRRGGFRGRGNFRGRGGFRGNYRGRGGFRGRGNYRARGGHRGFSSKSEESTVTDGEQEQAAPAKEVKKDSEATAESSS